MTIRKFNQVTSSGRYRSAGTIWTPALAGFARSLPPEGVQFALGAALRANRPHVGECAGLLGMVRQRDGSRVSAAGDAR